MMNKILDWLFSGAYKYLAAILGAIFIALKLRNDGVNVERNRNNELLQEQLESAKNAENEVNQLSDADIVKRLRERWGRK